MILTLRALISYSIWIFSHLKLCLATAIHNFKWLKIYVICEIYAPTYISVSRLKAYFAFNNWLYTGAYKKTVVDIGVLRVNL